MRQTLLLVGLALVGWGARALNRGDPAAWHWLLWGMALILLIVLERWRYPGAQARAGQQWTATEEQFIDPQTGQTRVVWFCAASGERAYLPLGETPTGPHGTSSPLPAKSDDTASPAPPAA